MTINHILDLIEQLPQNVEFDYVSGGESKAKLISVDRDNTASDHPPCSTWLSYP